MLNEKTKKQAERYEQFGIYYDLEELESLNKFQTAEIGLTISCDLENCSFLGGEFRTPFSVKAEVVGASTEDSDTFLSSHSLGVSQFSIVPLLNHHFRGFAVGTSNGGYSYSYNAIEERFRLQCVAQVFDAKSKDVLFEKSPRDAEIKTNQPINLFELAGFISGDRQLTFAKNNADYVELYKLLLDKKQLKLKISAQRVSDDSLRSQWFKSRRENLSCEDYMRKIISSDTEPYGSTYSFKGVAKAKIARMYRLSAIFAIEFLYGIRVEKTKKVADVIAQLKAAPTSDFGIKDVTKMRKLTKILDMRYAGVTKLAQEFHALGLKPVKTLNRWSEIRRTYPEWTNLITQKDSKTSLAQPVQDSNTVTLGNLLKD